MHSGKQYGFDLSVDSFSATRRQLKGFFDVNVVVVSFQDTFRDVHQAAPRHLACRSLV